MNESMMTGFDWASNVILPAIFLLWVLTTILMVIA